MSNNEFLLLMVAILTVVVIFLKIKSEGLETQISGLKMTLKIRSDRLDIENTKLQAEIEQLNLKIGRLTVESRSKDRRMNAAISLLRGEYRVPDCKLDREPASAVPHHQADGPEPEAPVSDGGDAGSLEEPGGSREDGLGAGYDPSPA